MKGSGGPLVANVPAMHAIGNVLTPGTPAYGLLKLAAVGGVLLVAARGRKRPPS
jgi:hypothetical protein